MLLSCICVPATQIEMTETTCKGLLKGYTSEALPECKLPVCYFINIKHTQGNNFVFK